MGGGANPPNKRPRGRPKGGGSELRGLGGGDPLPPRRRQRVEQSQPAYTPDAPRKSRANPHIQFRDEEPQSGASAPTPAESRSARLMTGWLGGNVVHRPAGSGQAKKVVAGASASASGPARALSGAEAGKLAAAGREWSEHAKEAQRLRMRGNTQAASREHQAMLAVKPSGWSRSPAATVAPDAPSPRGRPLPHPHPH